MIENFVIFSNFLHAFVLLLLAVLAWIDFGDGNTADGTTLSAIFVFTVWTLFLINTLAYGAGGVLS